MDTFKIVVDLLSSLAALVAITTVFVAWLRNRLPPVEIPRLIISPKDNQLRALLEIRNTKLYPLLINSFSCYRKNTYQIQRKQNEKPSLYPSFDVSDRLFTCSENIELIELGKYQGEFSFQESTLKRKSVIFIVHTSHGHFHLKPKNVTILNEEFSVLQEGEHITRESHIAAQFQVIKGYAAYIYEYLHRPFF